VKKLLAVAISNITYIRAIFPEHAYGDRNIEGLNVHWAHIIKLLNMIFSPIELGLKILRADGACYGATTVVKWMKGCFDAIDKKYVSVIANHLMPFYSALLSFQLKAMVMFVSVSVSKNQAQFTSFAAEYKRISCINFFSHFRFLLIQMTLM
jgi:hypothetical protein